TSAARRAVATTSAPASARPSANTRPMPLVPPTTTAIRPSRLNRFFDMDSVASVTDEDGPVGDAELHSRPLRRFLQRRVQHHDRIGAHVEPPHEPLALFRADRQRDLQPAP